MAAEITKGRDVLMIYRMGLVARIVLTAVVLAGLAVDAWVHLDLASSYDGVTSRALSQGDLFRAEASAAILAAVALVVLPRWYTAAFALLVTAAGVAAVLVYRYGDIGAFGPFPDMYEPVWYPKKVESVWGEGIAAFAALVLLLLLGTVGRTHRRTTDSGSALTHTGVESSSAVNRDGPSAV